MEAREQGFYVSLLLVDGILWRKVWNASKNDLNVYLMLVENLVFHSGFTFFSVLVVWN